MNSNEEMTIHKLDNVCQKIIDAHLFLKFHEIIYQSIVDGKLENNLFWGNSQALFYQSAVLKLAIVYDADKRDNDNLGIYKLLTIFRSNYQKWNKQLDLKQLKEDEVVVQESEDDLVCRLIKYRNALIAHTNRKLIGGTITDDNVERIKKDAEKVNERFEISLERPETLGKLVQKYENLIIHENSNTKNLSLEELYILVDRGLKICNRYRVLFDIPHVERKSEETINKELSFINLLSEKL
jgi:hypothetical protein